MAKDRSKPTGFPVNISEQSLRQFLQASQEVSNQYVEQYIPLLFGVNPDEASWEMIQGLAWKYMENKKPTKDVEQIRDQLMAVAESLKIYFSVKDRLDYIDKWELGWLMALLGSNYKIMTNKLIPASDIELSEELQDRFVRDRGLRAALEQHAGKEALYREAEEIGRAKWEAGDNSYHHEMVEFILGLSQFEDKKLSRNTLLKRLRPIAREYNRVRGDKGAKKEKY